MDQFPAMGYTELKDWKKQQQLRFLTDETNRRDEELRVDYVEQKEESAAAGLQEADLGNRSSRSSQPPDSIATASIATAGHRRYYGDEL